MNLTFCSYPRSGRHKLQALMYQLGNFKRIFNGEPLIVHNAHFFDSMDSPDEWLPIIDAEPVSDESLWMTETNRNHLVVSATHHVSGRIPDFEKIHIIRHPVAVAISVAKKWQSEKEKTDEEYERFLECFITAGARRAAEVWGGNVWPVDMVEFMSQIEHPYIKYEKLNMENLLVALELRGISAEVVREAPTFESLHEKDPVMYRHNNPFDHWQELPEKLHNIARRRYHWILRQFYSEETP